ncbi:MAG: PKD domain-containing protein [Thermoplasmata archaeon]|nr:PKD domain-containing protein [Thermoplasmata archaeon]
MKNYALSLASHRRWSTHRGLSTPTAAIALILVIVLVGGGGYFAFNSANTGPSTATTMSPVIHCSPPTSPICQQVTVAHDVSLLIPFASAQAGSKVPVTASVPSTDGVVASYSFSFGDGSPVINQTSATADHTYTTPGNYLIFVIATINGQKHDSYQHLGAITISSSFTTVTAADVPQVTGSIVANSSSSASPTAVLAPGGWIDVSGSYTGAPTNPDYQSTSPTITASPGGVIANLTNTSSQASAQIKFSNSGSYWVDFNGYARSLSTGAMVTQNFTFSVFVAPNGIHASTAGESASISPHHGSLVIYRDAPGGSQSEDPSIDYETLGFEVIQNVYETLIAYNGSDTGPTSASYVPVIAACVPGSVSGANNCNQLFPSEASGENALVQGNNYTFVITAAASFYDSSTGNHWGVYPTDVVFSLARTMAFAVLPSYGSNPGWIEGQSLLPAGNPMWDGDYHGARNNTPLDVMNSMTINGTDCPASAMMGAYHGCVTFNVDGAGHSWPYFLELIQDAQGSAIQPCAWFSAPSQGAGIPYWTQGNVTGSGDHPCGAMGSSGWGVSPSSAPVKGWDSWEYAGSQSPYFGNVQWKMVGSGPYYLNSISIGSAYSLQASPSYSPNPYCTWQGCWPAAGSFAASVSDTWEVNQLPGEEAYQAGVADFASIPSTDTGLLLQLLAQGKVKTVAFPSLSIDFYPFNLAFNVQGAEKYTTNPISVPSDVFSYGGLRQFIAHAYPYATIEQTINTLDGIEYDFNYGGAIPQFMANYYPTNISFPGGNPDTNPSDVGGAAWWWQQVAHNTSSPFYDPELAGCTAVNPCQFPLFGETGAPDLDERINDWASEINSLSGGALRANPLDINFVDSVLNSLYSGPYGNPMPVYRLGWAPDYPDPTDYMVPLYVPDSSYTYSDTDNEQLQLAQFNSSSCHPAGDWTWWSNYAQTSGGIPNNCQGAAYSAMAIAMQQAAQLPAGPGRVLAYAEIEQIANALALYVYSFQQNQLVTYAGWINGTSINSNVTIGGGEVSTWYSITGNGVAS